MIWLGIDHGLKRTGLALYDAEQDIGWPLELEYTTNLIPALQNIFKTRNISGIVVGWPIMTDGREGEQCATVSKFIAELQKIWSGIIVKWDERFTNRIATTYYGKQNDSLAAMLILEGYINSQRNTD